MVTTIIAIGNIARGDDGVAHRVLEHLEPQLTDSERTGLAIAAVHQLDFGMTSDLADTDLVIFIDAERRAEPAVDVVEVVPGPGVASLHGVDPDGLLGLAETLYGAAPAAYLVSVAAPIMEHVEGLSDIAEAASIEAASVVRALLAEHGGPSRL
jgi:hydrogenase maturation protease